MNYKKLYIKLFNAMTMAINELNSEKIISPPIFNAIRILITAQQETENIYIEHEKVIK